VFGVHGGEGDPAGLVGGAEAVVGIGVEVSGSPSFAINELGTNMASANSVIMLVFRRFRFKLNVNNHYRSLPHPQSDVKNILDFF